MPQNLLSVARVVVILVSLGLIAFLLWRGEMPTQVRLVVIAALAYYGVRLWVVGSRARRTRPTAGRRGPDAAAHGDPGAADDVRGRGSSPEGPG